MENLEKQCLEKLDKILSKFDLKINIINLASLNVWKYQLVDKLSDKTDWKTAWLGSWLSLNDLLFTQHSIFECLESYYNIDNNFNFLTYMSNIQLSSAYKRYSKAHQFIQPLKSNCLEELVIRMDLLGI